MNIQNLKDRLFVSLDKWADARIDDMVKGNPSLAIPSVYMKRAAHNIISHNKETWSGQIDKLALFVADENGEIDADTVFSDMMNILQSIDEIKFDFDIAHGRIGRGSVSIDLPDNILTSLLFGSKKSISMTECDFMELKELITE